MPTSEPRLCPELPHPYVSIYLFRCEHVGEWVAYLARGEASDDDGTSSTVRFGPFDTQDDVLDWLGHYVRRSLPSTS